MRSEDPAGSPLASAHPLEDVPQRAVEAVRESVTILQRLRAPDGCPWDREQTFDSIMRHTLEETYEVFDAIERQAWGDLRDELGDLFLQIVFYAQMASEQGLFTLADVVQGLNAKLIRRHPHIFAEASAETVEDVRRTWEAVKQQERQARTEAEKPEGLLDGVSRHQPAMMEARKLGAKAASVGFDWPDWTGLMEKLAEEAAELRVELESQEDEEQARRERVQDEFGDLLFTVMNLGRHLEVDPEFALRGANAKFRQRFGAMEVRAGGADALQALPPAQLEELWARAKRDKG